MINTETPCNFCQEATTNLKVPNLLIVTPCMNQYLTIEKCATYFASISQHQGSNPCTIATTLQNNQLPFSSNFPTIFWSDLNRVLLLFPVATAGIGHSFPHFFLAVKKLPSISA
ncbi:Transcriptional adapter ADA2a -like protein [Gossypium arboreum]|uniref:Transcriptional adapter ADA2a-like protein n=1 Tax=Gossypium arboreum TaxID=29729 RepID=A0A0B0NQB2_GOSAR|nr:Transcriptional adapter ADA2a -like protein [Gossypium arboreum]